MKYFQPPGVRADPPDVCPDHSPHLRPGPVFPDAVGGAGLLQQRRHRAVQPVQLPQLFLVHPGGLHAAGIRRLSGVPQCQVNIINQQSSRRMKLFKNFHKNVDVCNDVSPAGSVPGCGFSLL